MKASVYIATSLDGFIARENGALDWLPGSGDGDEGTDVEMDPASDELGFFKFFDSVDVLIMGRNTFEFVSQSEEWFYGDKRVIVLSSTLTSIPKKLPKTVELKCCTPEELIRELKLSGAKHLYIDGGKTIQDFLKAGFINQLIITKVPVLIGSGISLFGSLRQDIKLKHIASKSLKSGFVQSTYEIVNNDR